MTKETIRRIYFFYICCSLSIYIKLMCIPFFKLNAYFVKFNAYLCKYSPYQEYDQ